MAVKHPLHLAIANSLEAKLNSNAKLIRDPACGGSHQIPLFIGVPKHRENRMCQVDLLIIKEGRVRVIIEIEESEFIPTKICGKFLQAALATHLIHDSQIPPEVPYSKEVLFVQVLDGSKCLPPHTKKDSQAELIKERINGMIRLGWSEVTNYRLFFVDGANDQIGLHCVNEEVVNTLHQ